MVKDKKKKEKKEKKEKKKTSSQQPKEAGTYFPEALLEYQIQIKEEVIDQILYEIKRLEEINERCHERNQHLKAEQTGHIRALLTTLKEQEKNLDKLEIVTREDVDKAMKDKWQYVKDQEKLLKDLRSQISLVEQKLLVKQEDMDYWLDYKKLGSGDHAKQIEILEQDIKKLKEDLEEMTEFFRNALEETKQKIDKYTLKQMELKKEWATENAVKHIDSISCREIKEYEWLKEEVAIYRKEVDELEAAAHALEEENIYLIKKLFDRRLQYLRVPRKLFLTQGAGLQISADELEKMESKESPEQMYHLLYQKAQGAVPIIPFHGINSLGSASEIVLATEIQEEGEPEAEFPSELVYLRGQMASQFLPPLLYEDTSDFKEYKELGPLEVKLMSAVGSAMPIHEDIKLMPSRTQMEQKYDRTKASRITYRMIKSVFP
ncbi:coiled-coil domain-containing protein 83 [Eublepharis macularius]|uniref:Coiled-coil domain-containing protein 83 n=1 Tax=Eublepharis macularius TaxID=481883 RepID=A0AA97J493_EUBMA|nr:coiled-coil domain-containing protein 83 [Eublepharis macularius]XP_054830725.1 coiled-coil domain-containing protein 83 [Eublepharis macularius]XP_054830726.1 coiled-coil domain-containing protein 83 [Eublepharis macularius]